MIRGTARALVILAALLLLAWGAAALHFVGPGGGRMPNVLAGVWTLAGLGVLVAVRPFGRKIGVFALLTLVMFGWWWTVQPRNDRHWSPDVARLTRGTLHGDILTIENLRNFDYRSETDWTEHWETRTYDLSKLQGVDLFMSYWGSPTIAHTVMSWRFTDGQHLAISVELRKEVGETYSPIAGFFKSYELYYVVADERDVIGLRTNHRGENVYCYPLRMPRGRARKVLLDYVKAMNDLAERPMFYNTISHNCTTTIRTHVLAIGAAVPWDWRIYANGHADEMLYEAKSIDTSRPFAAVKAASWIDARAKAAEDDPQFSAKIRDGIVIPAPWPEDTGPDTN
jgi:hypothetical protein